MKTNKFSYQMDKETKNTIRFQPDAAAQDFLGQATIYIRKDALRAMGISSTKPLTITISQEGSTDE